MKPRFRLRAALTAASVLVGVVGDVSVDGVGGCPVGYWRLDEASGPTAADQTGAWNGT